MKTKDFHEKVQLLLQFFISGGQHKTNISFVSPQNILIFSKSIVLASPGISGS